MGRLGLVIAFGPVAIALLSLPLTLIFGCSGGAGGPGSCAIGGEKIGELVWTLGMMHWFALYTLVPGMVLMVVGFIVSLIVDKSQRTPEPSQKEFTISNK